MAVFNEPTKWQTSLVNSGDANVIPQSTPAGTGEASFDDGFPEITQIPVGAGGVAPDRKDFNGLFKILGDWIFFNQNGGVSTYSESFDYVAGRVVLYTDNHLYMCIQANGASSTVVAPTDRTYWSQIPTYTDLPDLTGVILTFGGSTVPEGFLLCNGAAISRTTYAKLFAAIGTLYGAGDGSTTFNLPDLRDRYIVGANINTLGTQIAEQLPNINGGGVVVIGSPNNNEPPLSTGNDPTTYVFSKYGPDLGYIPLYFNAHNSNTVYKDNGHVYPQSLALLPCIKY